MRQKKGELRKRQAPATGWKKEAHSGHNESGCEKEELTWGNHRGRQGRDGDGEVSRCVGGIARGPWGLVEVITRAPMVLVLAKSLGCGDRVTEKVGCEHDEED